MRYLLVALAAALLATVGVGVFAGTATTAPALDKKLIEYGWDVPFPDFIREHLREMERLPFDGLIFKLHGGGTVLEPRAWSEKQFQQDYEDLRHLRWRRFTDNFVILWAASDQDWFSDDHWRAIENNVRLAARAARIAGCVGVCFDPEPYGKNPWAYSEVAHRDTKTFAEYEAIARRRGAQFVRALCREIPRPHLLTLFQLSVLSPYLGPMDPEDRAAKLSQHHYALLPAFLNGMLDAAGDRVTITDGNEGAYYYTDSRQHFEVYQRITQRALALVDPALWGRYRSQVRAGQALYVDQYFGLRAQKVLGHHMTPDERPKWFEHNVYWSLYTTDKYVWCYSEKMNWWKNEAVPPGCEDAIRSAKARLQAGQPLGFDLEPIIEAARAREKAELQQRLKTRTAEIGRLPAGVAPPTVDGLLDDDAWRRIKPLDPFLPLATYGDQQVAETRAWVTYDDTSLYLAFRCAEPKPDALQIVGERHDDDLWQGDDVEVLLSAPGKTVPFYHFMINPRSVPWDGLHHGDTPDLTYNPTWQSAARVEKDHWAAEMAIPWAEMHMAAPANGAELRANLCRQRLPVRELSAWSAMASGFLEADLFGKWVFR